jgi:hypothetical protein
MLQGSSSNSVSCLSHICEEEQEDDDDDDAPGRVYHKSGSRDWIDCGILHEVFLVHIDGSDHPC